MTELKQPVWVCDCGKETPQPAKQPPLEKCDCGKPLRKVKSPDGVINEHFIAPTWFVDQFDEQDKRNFEHEQMFSQYCHQYFKVLKIALEALDKVENGRKAMKRTLEEGAKRLRLTQRKDMGWNFHRGIKRWIGYKRPEPPKGAK